MNLAATQSSDALLRAPIQNRSFVDIGPVPQEDQSASSSLDGSLAERRFESLQTVSGNRIGAPVTGGKIARPDEGAPSMEDIETMMSAIAALLQKFADAQNLAR